MATKCESCGKQNPKVHAYGPFVGSPMELDYCSRCSIDLCDNCMENARDCNEHRIGQHQSQAQLDEDYDNDEDE